MNADDADEGEELQHLHLCSYSFFRVVDHTYNHKKKELLRNLGLYATGSDWLSQVRG